MREVLVWISKAAALAVLLVEFYVIYWIGACLETGIPMPDIVARLAVLYFGAFCALLTGGVLALVIWFVRRCCRRNRRRCLGVVRFNRCGKIYYTKK